MIHYPYWSCYDGLGQSIVIVVTKSMQSRLLELHEGEGFTYRRIDAPKPLPPHNVDVTAETENQLPGQKDYRVPIN